MNQYHAFIPVRGGSKSIPLKNIQSFCGKPLVYWTVKAASDCPSITHVYVSTDSAAIRDTVEQFQLPKVQVIDRNEETATDTASTESVMLEFARQFPFDHIVLIQATSPLLESRHLEEGISLYMEKQADSCLSVVRQKRFLWGTNESGFGTPLNYDPTRRPRRQEWAGQLVENGAFYITSRQNLLDHRCRISGKATLYEMEDDTYFEIDETTDWLIAEQLKYNRLKNTLNNTIDFSSINLLICDVDGVLTDAGMYYSDDGSELKKFNTRDGKGFELLREAGLRVMLLTSEDNELVARRAKKLKVDYLFMGVKNKKDFLDDFFAEHGQFSYNRSAYIGDDVNDLDALKHIHLSATPYDGHPSLKSFVKYICVQKGGQGCVRELCELILEHKDKL
ncbi:N-acylneuraminate cytidylyltransferase [Paenibacillus hodogayensis]|uniref:N-acylneuraminate cytidylyltransferase n=1 Tax=Paenibacillus hodogayensis TaxID=279208 RepID=A0ABV5W874_9BACL